MALCGGDLRWSVLLELPPDTVFADLYLTATFRESGLLFTAESVSVFPGGINVTGAPLLQEPPTDLLFLDLGVVSHPNATRLNITLCVRALWCPALTDRPDQTADPGLVTTLRFPPETEVSSVLPLRPVVSVLAVRSWSLVAADGATPAEEMDAGGAPFRTATGCEPGWVLTAIMAAELLSRDAPGVLYMRGGAGDLESSWPGQGACNYHDDRRRGLAAGGPSGPTVYPAVEAVNIELMLPQHYAGLQAVGAVVRSGVFFTDTFFEGCAFLTVPHGAVAEVVTVEWTLRGGGSARELTATLAQLPLGARVRTSSLVPYQGLTPSENLVFIAAFDGPSVRWVQPSLDVLSPVTVDLPRLASVPGGTANVLVRVRGGCMTQVGGNWLGMCLQVRSADGALLAVSGRTLQVPYLNSRHYADLPLPQTQPFPE
jgi:hypothetical protein